jgi:4-hydroxy-tetrahydrodipicolinate synthase
MKQMMDAFWNGDFQTALDIHCRLLPVVDALFPPSSSNPIPLKAALKLQGFDCGGLRLPLVDANERETEAVRVAMKDAGLL